jgi:hypothetical protein
MAGTQARFYFLDFAAWLRDLDAAQAALVMRLPPSLLSTTRSRLAPTSDFIPGFTPAHVDLVRPTGAILSGFIRFLRSAPRAEIHNPKSKIPGEQAASMS